MPNNTATWPAATTVGGETRKANGVKATHANPTGSWGLIVYWGAFVAASGGTPEYTNPLDTPVAPRAGNTPVEYDVGALVTTWS